jgi:hypothetical protein
MAANNTVAKREVKLTPHGEFSDTTPREDYLRWTVDWCREVKR